MINKKCLYCHKEFRVYPYQETVGRGKYCSKLCADKSRIGKPSWNAGTGKFLICRTCGGKFRDKKWRNKLVYCSRKCQLKGEWKTKVVKTLLMKSEDYTPEIRKKLSVSHLGEKSHRWKGGKSKCVGCGKTTSRYDANYCRKCLFLNISSSEMRRRGLRGLVKQQSHKIPTSIEQRVYGWLEKMRVVFERQKLINGKFVVDAYVPSQNLVVECDGDYWHSLSRVINRDRAKNAYLLACGYNLIRISESEVNNGEFIKRLGVFLK